MQNVVSRDGAPIVMLVRAFACADHSALQRNADEKRPRPAVSRSRDHYAFAGLSAKNKAGFHDADNGETSRIPENTRRNAFLRHVAELSDRDRRAIDRVLLSRVRPN